MPRRPTTVRYVSPFGSPATLTESFATRVFEEDTETWDLLLSIGALTETQRRIGAPRLDDPTFHYDDLPVWVDGDDYDVVRQLVQVAHERARASVTRPRAKAREFVVISRDGKSAVTVREHMIDGDDERWSTAVIINA